MNRRIACGLAGIIVITAIALAWLAENSAGKAPTPSPAAEGSHGQSLDKILDRLAKLDERLAALEARSAAARTNGNAIAAAPTLPRRAALAAAQLPEMQHKPKPHSSKFHGCDARGDDGGDQDLNYLKNRIDEADEWIEVEFDAVLNQAFPAAVGKHHRSDWDPEDLAAVKKYEGLPLSIVCYFAWAKNEGPESCNCHIEDTDMYDIHTWLTKDPVQIQGNKAPDRSRAIVAEVTPRLKIHHPEWTQARIRRLAKDGTKVRISGWLLLDQEHPEQLKTTPAKRATRGTLWELHPIMEIEVWQNGQWVPLDDLEAAAPGRLPLVA
jgi:hypothetical protein